MTSRPQWQLRGVRAVITGSTKGIGLETAKEFLNLGASVVLVSRNAQEVSALVAELRAPDGPGMRLPPRLAGRDSKPPPAASAADGLPVPPAEQASITGSKARNSKAPRKCKYGVRCKFRDTCKYSHDDSDSTLPAAEASAGTAKLLSRAGGASSGGSASNSRERVFGCAADVSTSEGRANLVAFVTDLWGGALDTLVNNVGTNVRKPIGEVSGADYSRMMATNVDSTFFLCQAFEGHLRRGKGASVVNVASAAGLTSTGTGAVYAMTKAAMVQLTKNLACEWAKHNVRVNCVAPWMTQTPMLTDATSGDPEALSKAMAATPLASSLGRLPDPRESATAIAFLAMPAASYISGQTLSVDGAFGVHGFNGPCVDT